MVPDGALVVGRIGKAHGVKGEVSVDVRTDDPERRYADGSVVGTVPDRGPLTVLASRPHHGRLLVRFAGVEDRAGAEALRGTLLVVDAASAGEAGDGEWWDHELVGLAVVRRDGAPIGEVTEVVHVPGAPLLAVTTAEGRELLVPFVAEIVPEVDPAAGRLVVEPPPGLLELGG